MFAFKLSSMLYCFTNVECAQFLYSTRMTIPIRRLVVTPVSTPESPPYCPTSETTIWIIIRRSCFLARHAGTSHFKLQGVLCQWHWALSILSLHVLRFQIPEIQPGQWHHHCSNAKSRPSSTNYQSPTLHHTPRCCCYASLVDTEMFHNPRPVQIRAFPNTKSLLSR